VNKKRGKMEGVMTHAKARRNLTIVSHWGDCLVRKFGDGESITILRPDGCEITKETNRKGQGDSPVSEEFKQADLFGPDIDYKATLNADPNLFVSPCKRKKSETGSKDCNSMDTTQKEGEM
jgi:hypothetical protein